MKYARAGMSLFELLVVMTIIGVVYSVAIFSLDKKEIMKTDTTLLNLKKNLSAFGHTGKIQMICDLEGKECRVVTENDKIASKLKLISEGKVTRYGIDRFGELYPMDPTIVHANSKTEQASFTYTLYPDGTATALILKDDKNFYLYTPLGDELPFVTDSEEALKDFLYNEAHYPLKMDDYYAMP
jgi:prepilin-type N-terminal cleavage/methylation domain-containing protein